MYGKFQQHLQTELAAIREAGLYKNERLICGPQQAEINVGGKTVLNFCANNYLGLSNHPRLISAAKAAMDARGYGMSSVRFICGTQDLHKELEAASRASSKRTMPSSMPLASMPTAVFSNRCSRPKMPSSAMRSTTPRSSTAYASAKPSVIAMPMPIWRISSANCRPHKNSVSAL